MSDRPKPKKVPAAKILDIHWNKVFCGRDEGAEVVWFQMSIADGTDGPFNDEAHFKIIEFAISKKNFIDMVCLNLGGQLRDDLSKGKL